MNPILQPEFFLTYANTPLENNPQGLYKTLDVMRKIQKANPEVIRWNFENIQKAIDQLIRMDKIPFIALFQEVVKEKSKDLKERTEYLKYMGKTLEEVSENIIKEENFDFVKLMPDEKIRIIAESYHLELQRRFRFRYDMRSYGCKERSFISCYRRLHLPPLSPI